MAASSAVSVAPHLQRGLFGGPRWGHACCAMDSDNNETSNASTNTNHNNNSHLAISFGGTRVQGPTSELLVLDGTGVQPGTTDSISAQTSASTPASVILGLAGRWRSVDYTCSDADTEGSSPGVAVQARYGSAATYIPHFEVQGQRRKKRVQKYALRGTELENVALIIGGRGIGNKYFKDVLVYDPRRREMRRYSKDTGLIPSAGHTLTLVPRARKCYVFGGQGVKNKFLATLQELDGSHMRFAAVESARGPAPAARAGHVAFAVDRFLYIFGGYNAQMFFNDLHRFDTKTREWEVLHPRGKQPLSRRGHAVSLTRTRRYAVFSGGCTSDGQFLGDVFLLDLTKMRWIHSGLSLEPRFSHGSVTLPDGSVLLVAGSGAGILHNDVVSLFITDSQAAATAASEVMSGGSSHKTVHSSADPSISNDDRQLRRIASDGLAESSLSSRSKQHQRRGNRDTSRKGPKNRRSLDLDLMPPAITPAATSTDTPLLDKLLGARPSAASFQRFTECIAMQVSCIHDMDSAALAEAEKRLLDVVASLSMARYTRDISERNAMRHAYDAIIDENTRLRSELAAARPPLGIRASSARDPENAVPDPPNDDRRSFLRDAPPND